MQVTPSYNGTAHLETGVYFATNADGSSACGSSHFIIRAPASTILTLNYSGSAVRCDPAKTKRTLPHPGTVLFFCTMKKSCSNQSQNRIIVVEMIGIEPTTS